MDSFLVFFFSNAEGAVHEAANILRPWATIAPSDMVFLDEHFPVRSGNLVIVPNFIPLQMSGGY